MTSTATLVAPHRSLVPSLRAVLAFDAFTCLAMGTVLLTAASPLGTLLGLPTELLFWAGAVLVPCAALMAAAAAMRQPAPWLVATIVAGNAVWVAASIAVLFVFAPNGLGVAFVLAQAAAVVVLLVLERRGLATGR